MPHQHWNGSLNSPDMPPQQQSSHNGVLPFILSRTPNESWGRTPNNADTSTYMMGPVDTMNDPITRYRYHQLDDNRAIRLIDLLPGEAGDDIAVSLMPSLDNLPVYHALSYTRGNDPCHCSITVQNQNTTSVLNVRPNIYAALKNLRLRDTSIFLWIDSICINQEDAKEKSTQIAMMGQIFAQATTVLIWLGAGSLDTSDGDDPIGFILELLDVSNFDRVMQDESRKKRWQALEDLFQNKWFTRRWVLQDVALARSAILHWGKKKIHWEEFADAVEILASRMDRFSNLRNNTNLLNPSYARRKLPATTLVDIYNSLFRKTSKGEIIERKYSLETLVSILAAFEASDPRDAIYGVLALAKIGHGLVPNYEKDFKAVCHEFVHYCVNKSDSLDIICRHWVPIKRRKKIGFQDRVADTMPSWCPSVLGSSFATYDDPNSNDRLHGDSLVGLPDRKYYNASLGRGAWAHFDQKDEENATLQILHVRGLEVAEIAVVGPSASKGVIQREWLDMVGSPPSGTGSDISTSYEKLWRTLVADRDENGNGAPLLYRRAFYYCLDDPSQDVDIDTQKWINQSNTPSLVIDFLRRVQSVIWNRRLFTTAGELGQERFGLAPRQAQKGDIVCVIFGCSVPVLLRKHTLNYVDYYQLIGEVYLHDMMDGQALFGKTEQEVRDETKEFKLW
jgi:hypothetical protein